MDVQRRDFLLTGTLAAAAVATTASAQTAQCASRTRRNARQQHRARRREDPIYRRHGSEAPEDRQHRRTRNRGREDPAQRRLWLHLRRFGRRIYQARKSCARWKQSVSSRISSPECSNPISRSPFWARSYPSRSSFRRWAAMDLRMCRKKSAPRRPPPRQAR